MGLSQLHDDQCPVLKSKDKETLSKPFKLGIAWSDTAILGVISDYGPLHAPGMTPKKLTTESRAAVVSCDDTGQGAL